MFDFLGGGPSRLDRLQQQEDEKAGVLPDDDEPVAAAPAPASNWVAQMAAKNRKAGAVDEAERQRLRREQIDRAFQEAKLREAEEALLGKRAGGSSKSKPGSAGAAVAEYDEEVDGPILEDYMRRADYGRLIRMDANVQQANQVRMERMQIKRQHEEQREIFRQRGVLLRQQRLQTEAAIAGSIDSCRLGKFEVGDNLRARQQTLRRKRAEQEKSWEQHGRALTEKYSTRGNQELVRTLKKEVADERMRQATTMRNFLKKAKSDVDDSIREVNRDRVERVYAETAHPVIRHSKQTTVANRWDRADDVRLHVSKWKKAREENEQAYLQRAFQIHSTTQKPDDCAKAAQKRHEERTEYARQQTQWRKDIKAQREEVAANVRASKRSVRDSVEYGQLIRRQHVENEVQTTILSSSPRSPRHEDDPLNRFIRFFGFKSNWRPPPAENVTVHV